MFSLIPVPYNYITAAAVALAIAGAGAYGGYRFELGSYETLKASYAQAATKAVQKAAVQQKTIDVSNQVKAVADTAAQAQIGATAKIITKEIPIYVHDKISCPSLTVGLARSLYASASGSDAASLSLAAGQSDDDCSDATPTEVAGWFNSYASAARANAQQLNDLVASVKTNDAISEATK